MNIQYPLFGDYIPNPRAIALGERVLTVCPQCEIAQWVLYKPHRVNYCAKCNGKKRRATRKEFKRAQTLVKRFLVSDEESPDRGRWATKALHSFDLEDEAAEYIGTLPDYRSGRYCLEDMAQTDE